MYVVFLCFKHFKYNNFFTLTQPTENLNFYVHLALRGQVYHICPISNRESHPENGGEMFSLKLSKHISVELEHKQCSLWTWVGSNTGEHSIMNAFRRRGEKMKI